MSNTDFFARISLWVLLAVLSFMLGRIQAARASMELKVGIFMVLQILAQAIAQGARDSR